MECNNYTFSFENKSVCVRHHIYTCLFCTERITHKQFYCLSKNANNNSYLNPEPTKHINILSKLRQKPPHSWSTITPGTRLL